MQPTGPPVNENLMELLVMLDAFKRSSAARVTAVIPYYGYARQDRKDKPRVPITAKLVADLLSTAGTDRVLTMDLHSRADPGLLQHPRRPPVRGPRDHRLRAAPRSCPKLTVVSPDAGGVERARAYAKRLEATLAIVRQAARVPNVAEVHHVVGEVEGRTGLIVDDMVDTGGTLAKVAQALKEAGAARGAGLRRRTPCCRARPWSKIEREPALPADRHRLHPAERREAAVARRSSCCPSPS